MRSDLQREYYFVIICFLIISCQFIRFCDVKLFYRVSNFIQIWTFSEFFLLVRLGCRDESVMHIDVVRPAISSCSLNADMITAVPVNSGVLSRSWPFVSDWSDALYGWACLFQFLLLSLAGVKVPQAVSVRRINTDLQKYLLVAGLPVSSLCRCSPCRGRLPGIKRQIGRASNQTCLCFAVIVFYRSCY
jgi:hypothetical protein